MCKRFPAILCLMAMVLSACILPVHAETEELHRDSRGMIAAGAFHSVWIGETKTVNAVGRVRAYSGVEKWHDIVKVAAWNATVGIKENGKVVLTGEDAYRYNYSVISGWSDIVDVYICENNIAGLTAAGTVVVAGSNEYKQCNVSYWTDIVAVSAGRFHTIGMQSDGTIVVTGSNANGQCDF